VTDIGCWVLPALAAEFQWPRGPGTQGGLRFLDSVVMRALSVREARCAVVDTHRQLILGLTERRRVSLVLLGA